MGETNLNFSRCTVHPHQITWFASLLSSLVHSSAKAQPVTESNSARHTPYLELTLTVLIAAAAAILVVLLFSMFLRWCTDSSAASAAAYLYPRNATIRGLDPAVVETFPVLVYSDAEVIKMGEESLECAICLAKLEGGETLRLLPKCNHVFHLVCIDTWLASHVTCPVCRANLTPESTEMSKDENQQAMAAPNQENSAIRFNRTRDGIVITIDEEQNRDSQLAVVQSASQESNRQPKSGIPVKFPRSHSTGHSLGHSRGEDTERHTLRLPDELRRQLMTTAKLARTRSFNVFSGREWSSRRGYRSGGGSGGDGNRGRPIGTGPSSDRYSQ